MTIKIIGHDSSKKKRVTCNNCTSILEYTPNDLKEKIIKDYLGGKDLVKYLVCPRCDNEIHIL